MLKRIATGAGLALTLALLTAATTWTSPAGLASKAVCAVGNEGATGPTSATDGLDLADVSGFSVTLEANIGTDAGAQNLLASGIYMRAWLWNPHGKMPDGGAGGWWSRAPDLDLGPTTGGKLSETWHGFKVTAGNTRVAYLPESCGNLCTVYINGVRGN